MGNRFSTGAANSGDITSLAYDAAEQGDFGGLKTLQQAAGNARAKDDPQFNALAKDKEEKSRNPFSAANHWLGDLQRSQGMDVYDDIHTDDVKMAARQKALAGPDSLAINENAIINQFASLKSQRIIADSQMNEAASGIKLTEARGGSAEDIIASSKNLFAATAAGRISTQSEIALLQQDMANPINAGRKGELTAKIADAQSRLSAYDVTDAQRLQGNNAAVFGQSEAAFGLVAASAGQSLTRGVYGGKTFDQLQGS
jgi:hypothetical protein